MKISCVLSGADIEGDTPDLIVFPEGACPSEVEAVCVAHPQAFVVAAITENGHSRGILWHGGRNRIEYLKVSDDGRTKGCGNSQQSSVYVSEDLCIGVLICRDVQEAEFCNPIVNKIRSSKSKRKLLCIPADMGHYWFQGTEVPRHLHDVHVVVCNHVKTHEDSRCKSFITDMNGHKVVEQHGTEPIHYELS